MSDLSAEQIEKAATKICSEHGTVFSVAAIYEFGNGYCVLLRLAAENWDPEKLRGIAQKLEAIEGVTAVHVEI